jgi:hypothetical protein
MAVDFYIKKDDQLPEIEATLRDADLVAVDITGNIGVRFIMAAKGGAVKVDASATVVSAVGGVVKYSWQEPDTDTAGNFIAEFEVEFSDGRLETFPNSTNINIKVTPDLGGIR